MCGKVEPVKTHTVRGRILAAALLLLVLVVGKTLGNPKAPFVRAGEVKFSGGDGTLSILQKSQRAIIDWQEFGINPGELTEFIQNNKQAIALNKVIGNLPSTIAGTLKANGKIILINPNGIVVTSSGRVNTAGFIATTLQLKDEAAFKAGKQKLTFEGDSTATIVNLGSISATSDVFLVARSVTNEGLIESMLGKVGVGVGAKVTVYSVSRASGQIDIEIPVSESYFLNKGTVRGALVEFASTGAISKIPPKTADPHSQAILSSAVRQSGQIENAKTGMVIVRKANGTGGSFIARTKDFSNDGIIDGSSTSGRGGNAKVESTTLSQKGSMDFSGRDGKTGSITLHGPGQIVSSTDPATTPPSPDTPLPLPDGSLALQNANVKASAVTIENFTKGNITTSTIDSSDLKLSDIGGLAIDSSSLRGDKRATFTPGIDGVSVTNSTIDAVHGAFEVTSKGAFDVVGSRISAKQALISAESISGTSGQLLITGTGLIHAVGDIMFTSFETTGASLWLSGKNLVSQRLPITSIHERDDRYITNTQSETGGPTVIAAVNDLVLNFDDVTNKGSIIYGGRSLSATLTNLSNLVDILEVEELKKKSGGIFGSSHIVTLARYNYETPSFFGTDGALVLKVANNLVNTGTLSAQVAKLDVNGVTTNGFTDPRVTTPRQQGSLDEISLADQTLRDTIGNLRNGINSGAPGTPSNPAGTILSLADIFGTEALDGKTISVDSATLPSAARNAALRLVGTPHFSNQWTTDDAQWQGLVDNSTAFLGKHPEISFGSVLTPAQRALVDAPMVWFEATGNSFTPKVLLPLGSNTYHPGGTLQSSGNTSITAREFINTGYVKVGGVLMFNVDKFVNERRTAIQFESIKESGILRSKTKYLYLNELQEGGRILAEKLLLNARESVENSGEIDISGDAFISAPNINDSAVIGDVLIDQHVSAINRLAGAQAYLIGKTIAPSQINVGGDLTIQADHFSQTGEEVNAGGDINIITKTLRTSGPALANFVSVDDVKLSLSGRLSRKDTVTLVVPTTITSQGGSISEQVLKGDFFTNATSYIAAKGFSAVVTGKIDLGATIAENQTRTRGFAISRSGFSGSYQSLRVQTAYLTQILADTVNLSAGGDILGQAPQIAGRNGVVMKAGGNIAFSEVNPVIYNKSGHWGLGVTLKIGGITVIDNDGGAFIDSIPGADLFKHRQSSYGDAESVSSYAVRALADWKKLVGYAKDVNEFLGGKQSDSVSGTEVALEFSHSRAISVVKNSLAPTVVTDGTLEVTAKNASFGGGSRLTAGTFVGEIGENFTLEAGHISQNQNSTSFSVSVGISVSQDRTGFTLGGSTAFAGSEFEGYIPGSLSANVVRLNVGGDAILRGSMIKANSAAIKIGNNLILESLLNKSSSDAVSGGASITIGPRPAGSFNLAIATSDAQWAEALAGIETQEALDLAVAGQTRMVAGIINSASRALKFTTGSLDAGSLKEFKKSFSLNASFSTGYSGGQNGSWSSGGGFGFGVSNYRDVRSSVIGDGSVTVLDGSSLAGISRQLDDAVKVTKNGKFGINLSSDMLHATPEELKQDFNQIKTAASGLADVGKKVVKDIGERIERITSSPEDTRSAQLPTTKEVSAPPSEKNGLTTAAPIGSNQIDQEHTKSEARGPTATAGAGGESKARDATRTASARSEEGLSANVATPNPSLFDPDALTDPWNSNPEENLGAKAVAGLILGGDDSRSFSQHMADNFKAGLQSAQNFVSLTDPNPLTARDNLRAKYQAGTAEFRDYVDAFMEGGSNSPVGQAFNAVGGTVFNPVTTAIGDYVNPAISDITGFTPNEVAAFEMFLPYGVKAIKVVAPEASAGGLTRFNSVSKTEVKGFSGESVAGPSGDFYSVAFEMKLSPTSYPGISRAAHFQEANGALLSAMEADGSFAMIMEDLGVSPTRTSTGLAPRTSPAGWTWHHSTESGVMQLVPRSQHAPGSIFQPALHPNGVGGFSIWGQ